MIKVNLSGVRAAARHAAATPAAAGKHRVAAATEASVRLCVKT